VEKEQKNRHAFAALDSEIAFDLVQNNRTVIYQFVIPVKIEMEDVHLMLLVPVKWEKFIANVIGISREMDTLVRNYRS